MFRSLAVEALFGRSAVSRFERDWRLGMFALLAAAIVSAMIVAVAPAHAGNTNFLTEKGTINFPVSPPNRATPGPGAIDNMTIGATTPRPGHFTTLDSTSPPSGAGITDLFASPPPIGTTAPAAGSFSTFKSADGVTCATATPATAVDAVFFVATRAYILVSVSEVHAVAAGGASVLQIVKDTGTSAPGAGTDLLTNNTNGGFDLNATANTVQVGTLVAVGTRTLAAGDRLAYDFAQAIQSSAGIAITACLAPQ